MEFKILLGPLLGVEGELDQKTHYSVCFLSDKSVTDTYLGVLLSGQLYKIQFYQTSTFNDAIFWRADLPIELSKEAQLCQYQIKVDDQPLQNRWQDSEWSFYIPGINEKVQVAYASCNGFSSQKLARDHINDADYLWQSLTRIHNERLQGVLPKNIDVSPFSLLLMGGDQVYADAIFETACIKEIAIWNELSRAKQITYLDNDPQSQQNLKIQTDAFYFNLYIQNWGKSRAMSTAFATIPNIMMWDDHDIFDGWGSHAEELQNCPMFKIIFSSAKKYFEQFQIRSLKNKALQNRTIPVNHYGQTIRFRDFRFVIQDGRSNRTKHDVLGSIAKQDFNNALASLLNDWQQPTNPLALVVGVGLPLIYREFKKSEVVRVIAEKTDNYDDILDHWNFNEHRSELQSIIHHLFEFQQKIYNLPTSVTPRVTMVSGDVHVACAAFAEQKQGKGRLVQVVSSGIMHPPPSWAEWLAISSISTDSPEKLDLGDGVKAELGFTQISGADDLFVRSRNFVTLNHGNDNKLWANWFIEKVINALESSGPTMAPQVLAKKSEIKRISIVC